jgi:hypothetical protein
VNLDTSCANLDPGISSRRLSPDLSPSSRTFVELTLINWRRPWGSRRLDFVIRAGSFNFSIGDISKFFLHRQDQQILRLPTTEAVRSIQQNLSSTSSIIYIIKIFKRFAVKNRRVRPNQRITGWVEKINLQELHVTSRVRDEKRKKEFLARSETFGKQQIFA